MTPESFRELVSSFQQSRALLTAYEVGLFTSLEDRARSSAEAADALKTDPRATDRLMNVLVAMGLLTKSGDRYRNGSFAARYLVRDSPEYMAGLMHSVHLWRTWSTLTDAVRAGHAVTERDPGAAGGVWREAFIAAMHSRASQHAPTVVASLDLTGVARVIDVGGGSGAFATAFVRAKCDLRATVFDLPDIVPITRRYVDEDGFADRIDIVTGDLTRDELGRGFDLVFISAIVHSFPPDENRRLMKKSAAALNPGGQVVVQEFLMNDDRTGPLSAALFALNMLVATPAGDTYTESEVRSWMTDAGFGAIERRDMPFGTGLVIGRLSRSI
jgi:SAM-dependent methyltransferase